MKDFTLLMYNKLLINLLNMHTTTFEEYLKKEKKHNQIIIRHDVDRNINNAVKMAILESKYNIRSTYYFRYNKNVFIESQIKRIYDLGHEIGYHYETLSKVNGDMEKAITRFENELSFFLKICEIKTICMHGSPMSKYDNKNIWHKYNFGKYNIIGEPYISLINKDIYYFTDTGGSWNSKYNLRDSLGTKRKYIISDTNELIEKIYSLQNQDIMINIHPERWNDNIIPWYIQKIKDCTINIGKYFLNNIRCNYE